jgi:hypothetical protein
VASHRSCPPLQLPATTIVGHHIRRSSIDFRPIIVLPL